MELGVEVLSNRGNQQQLRIRLRREQPADAGRISTDVTSTLAQEPLEDALGDLVGVRLVSDRGPAAAANLLVVGREQPSVLACLEKLCVGPVAGRIGR